MQGIRKRIASLALALCCLIMHAAAETETNAVTIQSVNSLFTMGDTLYVSDWGNLYRLDESAQSPVPIHLPMTDGEEGLFPLRMTALGETIFFLENAGGVYSMTLDSLDAPEKLAALSLPEGEQFYVSCNGIVADEAALWVLLSVSSDASAYDQTALYRVERASGEVTQAEIEALTDLCAYKDGFLLARQWDRRASSSEEVTPQLVSIDKASLSVAPLCALPDNAYAAPAYDAAGDAIYLASPSKLLRIDGDLAQETCAYLSMPFLSDGAPAIAWKDRYLVGCYGEPMGLVSSPTDPSLMPERVLKLAAFYMDDATRAFCREHPEIAVEIINNSSHASRIADQLVAGSDEIDVYSCYPSFGGLSKLLKKGYCADLSGSAVLSETVGRMYPHLVADFYGPEGKLMALPYSLRVYSPGYSPSALAKLGLSEADLPRTYLDMLNFAGRWAEDFSDNEQGLTFLDSVYDIQSQLLNLFANAYVNRAAVRGEAVRFHTPLFLSLLAKFQEITPAILEMNPEEGENDLGRTVVYGDQNDATSLFTLGFCVSPEEYSFNFDYVPLPLCLEEGDDPLFEATMEVLLINPYSRNADSALLYLEYIAAHLNPAMAIALLPDANEPMEDSFYREQLEGSNQYIADVQERLKAASEENKKELEDELARALEWQKEMEAMRWAVSPEDIAAYRDIAPYVMLNTDNAFSYSNVLSATSRYMAGQMTAEQYTDEIDRVLRLAMLENE